MTDAQLSWLAAGFISALVAVVWYLLRQKDAKQAEEIKILFMKHDDDAKALADLRLEIAKEHYLKHELDGRFLQLDNTMKERFRDLGGKFDKLSGILVSHVAKEDGWKPM